MTQEEKIKQAGYAAYYDPYDPEATAKQDAFEEGARWAYEHPKVTEGLDDCSREDLLGLVEFYKQALEVQSKKCVPVLREGLLRQACRWLAHNAHEYLDADNGYDTYKMIEEFQKAMYK